MLSPSDPSDICPKFNLQAKTVANLAIKRIQTYNRRTLDSIAARVYFYFSLAYERSNELNAIRATLLGLHRTATLRHDEIGQVRIREHD